MNDEIGYDHGELVPLEPYEGSPIIGMHDLSVDDPEIVQAARRLSYEIAGDMVRRAMLYIIDDPSPKLATDIIGSAFGLRLRQGISDSDIAAKYGISKEAFDQRKKRFLKSLGIKRVIVRGGKQNTETYRDANYRNHKRTISGVES